MNKKRKIRQERIKKCLNILLLVASPEEIIKLSPDEVEMEVFNLINRETRFLYDYIEKWGL